MKKLNSTLVAAGFLIIAAATLYLLTLDNGLRPDELTGGDLITHQYAQVEARPGNAPGYPLYTMGGWLWFRLGRSLLSQTFNPIQILSFYSTLWGLASLVILFLIMAEIDEGQWPIAMLLTAFYATTFFFWYYSITTEQYTSAVFQTLLVIWLAFRWDRKPADATLLWLAFVVGTMVANMVTTIFILPPLLWFIFFRRTASGLVLLGYLRRPKFILQAVVLGLIPLLSYAFIYIRGVQHPEWRGAGTWPTTWAWFVDFITIQQGRDEFAPGLTLQNIVTAEFPSLMGQELTWLVFVGGLLGIACLGRRRAIFLYGTLLIYLIFSWGYRFGNWFQVIIPAYPIFIIGFAAGLMGIRTWLELRVQSVSSDRFSWPTNLTSPVYLAAVVLLLLSLVLGRLVTNLPRANQSDQPGDTGLDPGWAIVFDDPASPAVISSHYEERIALQYLQAVWGVLPGILPTDSQEVRPEPGQKSDDPVLFISRRAIAISPGSFHTGFLYPQAAGEQLIALQPEPESQLPALASPVQLEFGSELQLVGWEQIEPKPVLPPDVAQRLPHTNWQIALYWQPSAKLTENYTVSVRPLLRGQVIMNGEQPAIQDHQPVWGIYPTSKWTPHEVIRDVYALSLPAGITPDAMRIIVYKTTGAGFEILGEQIVGLVNTRQ